MGSTKTSGSQEIGEVAVRESHSSAPERDGWGLSQKAEIQKVAPWIVPGCPALPSVACLRVIAWAASAIPISKPGPVFSRVSTRQVRSNPSTVLPWHSPWTVPSAPVPGPFCFTRSRFLNLEGITSAFCVCVFERPPKQQTTDIKAETERSFPQAASTSCPRKIQASQNIQKPSPHSIHITFHDLLSTAHHDLG